ncbi:MAG: ABC transporter ATP-binding protein [Candidatus Staskawiczbacteria bacterium]|nr:ABC transporter ATP-binding protein [Candidatus Staskawiczbacteria bacterium]
MQGKIVYPKISVIDVLKAFWRGMEPQKWKLFVILFGVIATNFLYIVTPLFYKQFFDTIFAGGETSSIVQILIRIIVYIAVLHGLAWLFTRIAELFNNVYQPMTMANLKQQAYGHLIEHSYSFFTNNFVGSLVQRVNRFGRAFERLSDNIIWHLLPLIVRVFGVLVVLFFINKWIDLVVLIWVSVFLTFNIFFSRWKLKYDIKAAEVDSKATGYLADTITNQNTVSLFNGVVREKRGYKNITGEQASLTNFRWNLDAVVNAVQSGLSFGIELVLFYFAIRYWSLGIITVGVFVLLQSYAGNLIDQLWGFTRIVRDTYEAYADAKEMVEIMTLPHEIQDVPKAKDLKITQGEIQFDNLQFGFNDTRSVLKNINITIRPGEKVALIGPSGAGKTTFVRLLLRLYSPTSGSILIDGQDITKATQSSLRENISLVPQDPVLFHRALSENIAYGKPNASRKEIERAAKAAHCDEFIKTLPQGPETLVGERGIRLSGGERQRVAIARAILKNAPILILDEATSSLDSHSEMLIQDALVTLMQGKTTIVIAHRLSTIQKMDRIIVIDKGKIIEEGSHATLLENPDSLYKKLWTLQAGGFLTEDDEDEKGNGESENID